MAITARAEGTWAELTADGAVTIPGGATTGDRMYLLASWKDFSVTATASSAQGSWTEVTEFADGAVANGNGTGSMKTAMWYRDHSGTEGNPTIDFSASPNIAGAVIIVFQKAATETWDDPRFVTQSMTTWTTTSQTVSSSGVPRIDTGDLIIGLIGIRDDSATMTRPTTGISAGAVTFTGNYVEYPATHLSTTTANDMSADAGYRITSSVSSATNLAMTGTISAAETGAALWILQGVSPAGLGQAQADIKQTSRGLGQTQADIKQTYTDKTGQTQADIKQIYTDKTGQTQADIKQTYTDKTGQTQARIKQTYTDKTGQTQADIKATNNVHGQAQAYIAVLVWKDTFTRTESGRWGTPDYGDEYSHQDTNAVVTSGYGTTITSSPENTATFGNMYQISDVIIQIDFYTTGFVSATPVRITTGAFYTFQIFGDDGWGVQIIGNIIYAQQLFSPGVDEWWTAKFQLIGGTARTKVWKVGTQEPNWQQEDLVTIPSPLISEEVVISSGSGVETRVDNLYIYKLTTPIGIGRFGQVQAYIKATSRGLGQAQALIIPTRVFGQSQADIKQTYYVLGQALAFISPFRGYGQAQVLIAGDYNVWVDTFTRAVSDGVGTADVGGSYTNDVGDATDFDVDGSTLKITIDSAQNRIFRLRSFLSSESIEIFYQISFDTLPLTGNNIIYIGTLSSNFNLDLGLGLETTLSAAGNLTFSRVLNNGVAASSPIVYTVNDIYNVKAHYIKSELTVNGSRRYVSKIKFWKEGDIEPGWIAITSSTLNGDTGQFNSGIIRTLLSSHTGTVISTIDNINIKEAWMTNVGQAQAYIQGTVVAYGHGQSQAEIKQTYTQSGQAQADIKQTYFALGQAQGTVLQTYFGLGQTQADIKNTYFGLGQAQGTILNTYFGLGQTQSDIKQTYNVHGQTQADIKATSNAYGQTQAWIEVTNNSSGQAQGTILATSTTSGQAQAKINAFDFNQHGQANALILGAFQRYGQAQATIKAFNVNAYGQAQGDIKATYRAHGQAQATVVQTSTPSGQTQADIKQTYVAHGQTQADIKATINSSGQAQGTIKAVGTSCGQAQADIKQIYQVFAQAQAYVIIVQRAYGQAQGAIKITNTQTANAQGTILQTYNGSGNAQSVIQTDVTKYAQAQGLIKASSAQNSQAQALITRVSTASGQTQALILATSVVTGQTQGTVIKAALYGQARAFIHQDRVLKNMVVSDEHSVTLTVDDAIIEIIKIPEMALTMSDNTEITLRLDDENY